LESSKKELQVGLRPHPNQRSEQGVMNSQNPRSPNWDNFGTPLGSLRKKCHSNVGAAESCREYYMGEGVGFPQVWAVVSHVSPRLPEACPSTRSVPKCELTNVLVDLTQVRVTK
jgi:hypothetical protein